MPPLRRPDAEDYTRAALEPANRAMLDYAVKLTKTPWLIQAEDIDTLREQGFSDVAIHASRRSLPYSHS